VAWLYRRKRGGRYVGPWHARAKVNGGDVRESLRTSSKVVARQRLKDFERRTEQARYHGEERISWKRAVVEWAAVVLSPDQAKASIKASVAKRYKASLRQIAAAPVKVDKTRAVPFDSLYVDEIGLRTMAAVVEYRKNGGGSGRRGRAAGNATIRRDLTAISSVMDLCCAKGWREDNPARAYNRKVIREKRDPIVLPAAEDIDAVVGVCPGNFALLVRLAQYSGMRQEELGSLELAQLREGAVDLVKTKTDRPRSVPLDARAQAVLSQVVRHLKSKAVFWHDDGKRYSRISARFRVLMAAAVKRGLIARAFRFHDLRHWFAVDYLRPAAAGGRGGSIYDLQKILGHSSIKTTEIYLDYLTPEEAEQAKRPAA
jgi:integrase/recombinase XerD